MELFDLLPAVIRLLDTRSDPDGHGNIQKWTEVLDDLGEETTDLIEGLRQQIDVDACDAAYLPWLRKLVGATVGQGWSTDKVRMFLKGTVLLWKAKGTHPSWNSVLNLHGYGGYEAKELQKSILYETFDYSLATDYGHGFLAARVDVRQHADTSEPPNYGLYTPEDHLEPYRPIHVLLRRDGETLVEDIPAIGTAHDTGSQTTLTPSIDDEAEGISMETDTEFTCVATCESTCQTECTTGCETSCMVAGCEAVGCELTCELTCQESCMYVACQFGACEGTCENPACQVAGCQVGCQVACQTGVEP